jgi:hypothetical protein
VVFVASAAAMPAASATACVAAAHLVTA